MKRSRALAALGAAAVAPTLPARAQAPAKLRVAFPTLDSTSEVMFAADMGFFERAGLDVELMPLVNGAAIAAGVASGAIDIGLGNTLTVITAYKKGLPFTIIAPAAMNVNGAPANVLLVTKTSPIASARDLNGKVIGVSPLRAIGEVAISQWMDKNGGDSASVKYIEVPFSQAESVLVAGRADAAFSSEPFITQARADTRILANPFSVIGENWLITAFFANKAWAQAHPDLVARFDRVVRETAIWANKNQDTSAGILAKYAKMDVAVVKETVRARFAATLTPAQLQPTIDASARYKLLDASFPASDLIFQPS
jgi:NitT/TauT family transport system substrate-binding protein